MRGGGEAQSPVDGRSEIVRLPIARGTAWGNETPPACLCYAPPAPPCSISRQKNTQLSSPDTALSYTAEQNNLQSAAAAASHKQPLPPSSSQPHFTLSRSPPPPASCRSPSRRSGQRDTAALSVRCDMCAAGRREMRRAAQHHPPGLRRRTGVRATVGGKRIGDAALWTAYARATVPTCVKRAEVCSRSARVERSAEQGVCCEPQVGGQNARLLARPANLDTHLLEENGGHAVREEQRSKGTLARQARRGGTT